MRYVLNANHIVKYTSILCHAGIQRMFHPCQKDQNHEDEDEDEDGKTSWYQVLGVGLEVWFSEVRTSCDDGKYDSVCKWEEEEQKCDKQQSNLSIRHRSFIFSETKA